MGLFSFLKNKPQAEWCATLSNAEYHDFMTQLKSIVAQAFQGATIDVNSGLVVVSDDRKISLFNAARMWKMAPKNERFQVLASFFESMAGFDQGPVSFEEAEPNLRTRLYPFDPTFAELPSCLQVVEGSFLEMISIDGEKTVRTALPEEIEAWGKSKEELSRIGRANVFAKEQVQVDRSGLEGIPCTIVEGENFFVASLALELERFVIQDDSPTGVLLAIPCRSMFVFTPVKTENLLGAIGFLASFARHVFVQDPGGVSPDVFWWENGQLSKIAIDLEKQDMKLPTRLQSLLSPPA